MLLDNARSVRLGSVPVKRMMSRGFEVWPKTPVGLAASATRWDQVTLTITPPMIGADSYVIRRGSTQIYSGPALTFVDTLLVPSTTYSYTVDAVLGIDVHSTGSASATTPARAAIAVSGSSPRWDQVSLTWTDPSGGSIDQYRVKRSGTIIYTGPAMSFTDAYPASSLMPSTAYSYAVEALRGGAVISTSAAKSVTTAAHADMGMTYSQLSYSYVLLSWTDSTQGTIDKYSVYRNDSVWIEDSTSAGDKAAGVGLAPSTGYSFTVRAYRNGVEIGPRDSVSFTTPVRPTASGSWTGPGSVTSGGWTSCTAQTLTGPTAGLVGGCYVSSLNFLVWGHGTTGHYDPHVNGSYRGLRDVSATRQYQHVDGGNVHIPSGTCTTGAKTGGNCSRSTDWDGFSGANWNAHYYWVSVGTINYWWYTGREADDYLRTYPWWNESLAEREIHLDTWGDAEGGWLAVKVYDKNTEELLVEWGEIPSYPTPVDDGGAGMPGRTSN